jgi:hypothetical protein
LKYFKCQSSISSVNAKPNSAKLNETPTSQQKAMVYFYNGSSQFIVRYIYSSDSEGAHTAISCNKTTFQALELIVVSTSFANFQLIVDLFLIQNREGAREVPITHYSASEGDRRSITFSLKNIHLQRLIVEFIKADIKNVQESRALSTTLPMLHNRNSKFIVASHYSKTFLHFSKGFAIFCEGDQENMNNGNDTEDNEVVIPQKSNLPSLLLLASAISTQAELDTLASPDIIGFSNRTGSNGFIGVIGLDGHISLVSLVGLIVFGLVSNHISLVSLSGLSGLIGFDGFDGFGSLALSASAALLASQLRSLFGVVGCFGLLCHVNRYATPDRWVYIKVSRGMYGLPQAGSLGHNLLEQRLNKEGYFQSQIVPALWRHESKPIQFVLVVDNFGIKYLKNEDLDQSKRSRNISMSASISRGKNS